MLCLLINAACSHSQNIPSVENFKMTRVLKKTRISKKNLRRRPRRKIREANALRTPNEACTPRAIMFAGPRMAYTDAIVVYLENCQHPSRFVVVASRYLT
jgi:hypothetical protein